MSIHVIKRVSDLGVSLILSPERFDPRRRLDLASRKCLADLVDAISDNVSAQSFESEAPVLILDTTHAYEGFMILRHGPATSQDMGSSKRQLAPGDVVISRLRPYLRQVAYVDTRLFELAVGGNAVVASTEFFVIRGRQGFDAAGLVPFLLSEPVQSALAAGQEGGHHPRFSRELLMSLPVPEHIVASSTDTAERVRALTEGMRQALLGSKGLVEETNESMRNTPAR